MNVKILNKTLYNNTTQGERESVSQIGDEEFNYQKQTKLQDYVLN